MENNAFWVQTLCECYYFEILYYNFSLGMFKNSYTTSGHKNIDVFPKPIYFLLNEEFIKALKKWKDTNGKSSSVEKF